MRHNKPANNIRSACILCYKETFWQRLPSSAVLKWECPSRDYGGFHEVQKWLVKYSGVLYPLFGGVMLVCVGALLCRCHRYTAYLQLLRLCWGYLGKDFHVPLPSSAVLRIWQECPSPLIVKKCSALKSNRSWNCSLPQFSALPIVTQVTTWHKRKSTYRQAMVPGTSASCKEHPRAAVRESLYYVFLGTFKFTFHVYSSW